jgi:hypothetical protein
MQRLSTSWTAIALQLSLRVIVRLAPLTLAVFVTPTSFHSASNKKSPSKGLEPIVLKEID